jgi:D-alanyl-D-alanine carboxypeptidase
VQGRFQRLAAAVGILAVTVVAVVKLGAGDGGSQPTATPVQVADTSIMPATSAAEAGSSTGGEATGKTQDGDSAAARALSGSAPGAGAPTTDKLGRLYAADAKKHRLARQLSARSFVAIDADTGEVLLAYREHRRLPIASLTKMMTGLIASEAGDPKHEVLVTPWATRVEPNKDGLLSGHRYPRRTLLYSALLGSNNDAAEALGVDLGGSAAGFYAAMNLRAEELGLTETRYASASGLEDLKNTSTALDQALLLRAALENPTFARTVKTWRIRIPWEAPTGAKIYENHNKMLRTYAGTYGGKTGWTTRAKGCLAVAVERNGQRVIAVVLGANDIWSDMPKLVDQALVRAKRANAA